MKKIIAFLRDKYFRFGLATAIYILFVIWLGNYWFFLGIPIIYDVYISKKVNWTFWKKRDRKNPAWIEWLDALIFAVVAVTLINIFLLQNYKIPTPSMEKTLLVGDHLYVSKVAYGPKIPNTPLTFPFTQNRMPLIGGKSYLEWIQLPYKRLAGFGAVQRNDIVVFNFPAGDTVVLQNPAQSFNHIIRDNAYSLMLRDNNPDNKSWEDYLAASRQMVINNYDIEVRPVDRRDNYIKRCVAIPGDTLHIVKSEIFVNGIRQEFPPTIQHEYTILTNGTPINPKAFERMGIAGADISIGQNYTYSLPLSEDNAEKISKFNNVGSVQKYESPAGQYNFQIFPHDRGYPWTLDHFGPLYIPAKGDSIRIDSSNISFYKRIIDAYEKHDLEIRGGHIFIDDEPRDYYIIEMDYYFMMGDNRHRSADSRYWGFVPEDHILGKPKFIWLSIDKEKNFLGKIRFKRFFMSADR